MDRVPLEDTVFEIEWRTFGEELAGAFPHPSLERRNNNQVAHSRVSADEIGELISSELSEHPLMESIWEAGDRPIEIDPGDFLVLTRAVNQSMRAAILRLAEEVEELKARQ
jgi:hypothetical protein